MPQDRIPILIKQIKDGKYDPGKLNPHERRLCVQYLRLESDFSHSRIGVFLKVSRSTVIRDCKHLNNATSIFFDKLSPSDIAQYFVTDSLHQKERARVKGDGWLEWKITRDLVDILKELGVIKGVPLPNPINNFGTISVTKIEQNEINVALQAMTEEQKLKFEEACVASGIVSPREQPKLNR